MQGATAQGILNTFENYKNQYAGRNIPFPQTIMDNIDNMVGDIDWGCKFSKEDGAELKAALGFDSYKKALTGDYSEFELVHPVLRNQLAMKQEKMYRNTLAEIEEWRNDPAFQGLVDERLKPLMFNPALRLGMSLMQNDESQNYSHYRTLDDRMIGMIMEDTLKPMTPDQMRNVNAMADNPEHAQQMIETNVEKQVQMAKMMFVAHLGQTNLVNDAKETVQMDRSVASMMAHCSRTAFVFPPGNEKDVTQMMGHLTGAKMGKGAGIYGRFAATHSTAHGKTFADFKELKSVSFRHQHGMDVAIGGLGNPGIKGRNGVPRTLDMDGTCGHMYMRVDKGGPDKTSSLLVGFESDAPGKQNQQGHGHSSATTGEYMSSFLGQRVDEMGAKYGGRMVDCTMFRPDELSKALDDFTSYYRGMAYEAMTNPEARKRLEQANAMLSGTLMKPDELAVCLNKAGMDMDRAQVITQISANKKGQDFQMDTAKVGERSVKPMASPEKPSKRVRFRAKLGNTAAKKLVRDYKEAKVDRKDAAKRVAMSFSEFSKEAAEPKARVREVPKVSEKKAPTVEPKKKSWNPFSKK